MLISHLLSFFSPVPVLPPSSQLITLLCVSLRRLKQSEENFSLPLYVYHLPALAPHILLLHHLGLSQSLFLCIRSHPSLSTQRHHSNNSPLCHTPVFNWIFPIIYSLLLFNLKDYAHACSCVHANTHIYTRISSLPFPAIGFISLLLLANESPWKISVYAFLQLIFSFSFKPSLTRLSLPFLQQNYPPLGHQQLPHC